MLNPTLTPTIDQDIDYFKDLNNRNIHINQGNKAPKKTSNASKEETLSAQVNHKEADAYTEKLNRQTQLVNQKITALQEKLKRPVLNDTQTILLNVSSYTNELAEISYGAGVIANLTNNKKLAANCNAISHGAGLLASSCSSMALSGFSLGPASLFTAGFFSLAQGIGGLFSNER